MARVEGENYALVRDEGEAKRLEHQHRVYLQNQGYHVHPDIPVRDGSKIAELATGTGIWLREVAQIHPQTECHGFDLVDRMFPDSLPQNVKLHKADAKKPFDAQWLGYFDIVHIRFIQFAMTIEEWDPLVKNLVTLLKPGGWLQWSEIDAPSSMRYTLRPAAPHISSEPPYYNTLGREVRPPKFTRISEVFNQMLPPERRDGISYGFLHLSELFREPAVGNLDNVAVDSYQTNSSPELTSSVMMMLIDAIESWYRGLTAAGQKPAYDFGEWKKEAFAEIDQGASHNYQMALFIGQKKKEEEPVS